MVEISKGYAAELGGVFPDDYVVAREIWHDYLGWRQIVKDVSSRRVEEERFLLPEDTIRTTWSSEGIQLLENVDAVFPPDACASHAEWHQTLSGVAASWQLNLNLLLCGGSVHARPTTVGEEPVEHTLADIGCVDWLWLVTAEDNGNCQLEFSLPDLDWGELTRSLGANGDDPDVAQKIQKLQELIEEHIEDGLRNLMNRRSTIAAFLEADKRFRARLELRPMAGDQARSIFLASPNGYLGLAVVRRDGQVVDTALVDPDTSVDEVLAWMSAHAADDDPIVVPQWTHPFEFLESIMDRVPEHTRLTRVPPDGLVVNDASGEVLTDAAVELVRRAFKPRRTWLECPIGSMELLGRGVRLSPADDGKLNRNLREIREEKAGTSTRNRNKVPSEAAAPRRAAAGQEPRKKKKRNKTTNRNPQVSNITDLEPGMELQGKVTNLNRFGAFVDVGIPKEGLIPIHSLTDGFADSPTSVVRPGYEVRVTVVSVNPTRRRFDLRLEEITAKTNSNNRRGRSRGGRKGGRRGQGGKGNASSERDQSDGRSSDQGS